MNLKFAFKVTTGKGDRRASDHTHKTLELVYFLDGSGQTTIQDQTYEIQNNCFCVIPSDIIHGQFTEKSITTICIGITNSGLETSQGLWVDSTGKIKARLEDLMEELSSQKTAYSLITEGYLITIVGLVKRAIKENAPQDRKQALVSKALHIIEEKSGNLSIDEIAGQLFVSKDYLRHLFTHYTGQSPMRTIVSTRIDHAKQLLLNPELSVVRVAELCGFDNPYYFSRLFKSYTGKSPSAYRKN